MSYPFASFVYKTIFGIQILPMMTMLGVFVILGIGLGGGWSLELKPWNELPYYGSIIYDI